MKKKFFIFFLVPLITIFLQGNSFGQSKGLIKVRMGLGSQTVNPIFVNYVAAIGLGYFEKEGLDFEIIPVGDSAKLLSSVSSGATELAVGIPPQLLRAAANGELKVKSFYNYLPGWKYEMMVVPNSPIKRVKDLKGKILGIETFGGSPALIASQILAREGIDPEKEVQWVAVGAGTTAALALNRKQIDAYITFDTQGGQIDLLGFKFKHLELPRPPELEETGALYIVARENYFKEAPQVIIGVGRAVTKGTIFTIANLKAAICIFFKLHPEAVPEGKPMEKAIADVMQAMMRRVEILKKIYPDKPWGWNTEKAWRNESAFYKIKVANYSQFFTNEYLGKINEFDQKEVIKEAQNYRCN